MYRWRSGHFQGSIGICRPLNLTKSANDDDTEMYGGFISGSAMTCNCFFELIKGSTTLF
jgi:hypothetical protein